jgi:hypothetical protein
MTYRRGNPDPEKVARLRHQQRRTWQEPKAAR